VQRSRRSRHRRCLRHRSELFGRRSEQWLQLSMQRRLLRRDCGECSGTLHGLRSGQVHEHKWLNFMF
jgi:hypothetical protein